MKEAAKLTSIKVVSIVGGMSTEKQERLLKRRPEIIVATPGRLWELMSGGEQHLVEVSILFFKLYCFHKACFILFHYTRYTNISK